MAFVPRRGARWCGEGRPRRQRAFTFDALLTQVQGQKARVRLRLSLSEWPGELWQLEGAIRAGDAELLFQCAAMVQVRSEQRALWKDCVSCAWIGLVGRGLVLSMLHSRNWRKPHIRLSDDKYLDTWMTVNWENTVWLEKLPLLPPSFLSFCLFCCLLFFPECSKLPSLCLC